MAERKFPIQDGPSVPWEFMVSHEAQHKKNHGGQTLERMAQRGGLGATEAWCCVNGMGLWPTHDTKEGMAKAHQDWIALAERVNREWNEKSIQAEVLATCIRGAKVYFDDFRDVPPPPITIEEVIRFLRGVQPAAEALEGLLRKEREKVERELLTEFRDKSKCRALLHVGAPEGCRKIIAGSVEAVVEDERERARGMCAGEVVKTWCKFRDAKRKPMVRDLLSNLEQLIKQLDLTKDLAPSSTEETNEQ